MARTPKAKTGGDLGFEAELFKAADKLRGNMEPSDYKHVALGLIFLKHISEGFEAKRAQLLADYPEGAEDEDEYRADHVFWVPKGARWSHLQAGAKQPGVGKTIDDAMLEIEKVNPSLKGVLPKDYARPGLNAIMLGELIDLISGIGFREDGDKSRDVLGRVYEYFLGQFAGSEGKRGGEFYTPRSVVRTMVEMLEPYIRAEQARGEAEGLTQDEIAFYDALADNESAVDIMGNDSLKVIAAELVNSLKANATVDWSHRESARARMRVLVKRILRKYGFPPDLQDEAVQTVIQQAELLAGSW